MKIPFEKLKKIVVDQGFVDEKDFLAAEKESIKKEKDLEDILIERDLIEDEQLGKLIAQELGYPFISLKKEIIDEVVLKVVPEIVAKKQKTIAFAKDREGIKLATPYPNNLDFITSLQKKIGEKIIPYYATKQDVIDALSKYKKPLQEEFEEMIKRGVEELKTTTKKELPIIKITNLIIEYGYQNKSSDIHIEPQETRSIVRYRIDGILHDILELPRMIHDYLVARIKILAQLRIDEHRAAQDGRFSQKFEEGSVDLRVSIAPITKGEKVVMRLLSEKVRRFDLEDLGFSEKDLSKVKKNIKKPSGMILATGPTGSGKTTSLYAVLKILNRREINIATIEDPVEYDIEGVNQIQVDSLTNLTFAEGLRALVRQDPDIIMVGEIRDKETAEIAVNAALTGHLVLSTFHTNDAPTTLPRLINLGVKPFLIASTVNLIIAQRLIRKICPKCITSREIEKEELLKMLEGSQELVQRLNNFLENKKNLKIYSSSGCPFCYKSGYLGRIGIYEVLEISESLRELIMKQVDATTIRKEAIREGMITMLEDGLEKALAGLTTIEEVLREAKE